MITFTILGFVAVLAASDDSFMASAKQSELLAMALKKAPEDAMLDFQENRCVLYTVGPANGYLPGTNLTMKTVASYYSIVDMEDGAAQANPLNTAIHSFNLAYASEYNRVAVKNCGGTI